MRVEKAPLALESGFAAGLTAPCPWLAGCAAGARAAAACAADAFCNAAATVAGSGAAAARWPAHPAAPSSQPAGGRVWYSGTSLLPERALAFGFGGGGGGPLADIFGLGAATGAL